MKKRKTKNPLERLRRLPGQSSEEKLSILEGELLLWIVTGVLSVVIILIEWMFALTKIPLEPTLATVVVVIFDIFVLWKIYQIRLEIHGDRLGRDGERAVAQTLENLIRLTGCYVHHSCVFNHDGIIFDIDHIVVSKFGVFVIETKTRSKSLNTDNSIEKFDGKSIKLTNHPNDPRPINQVRMNINTLKKTLQKSGIKGKALDITGIVVYPGWFYPKDKMDIKADIWVSNAKYLQWAIPSRETIFTSKEVDVLNQQLEEILERETPSLEEL